MGWERKHDHPVISGKLDHVNGGYLAAKVFCSLLTFATLAKCSICVKPIWCHPSWWMRCIYTVCASIMDKIVLEFDPRKNSIVTRLPRSPDVSAQICLTPVRPSTLFFLLKLVALDKLVASCVRIRFINPENQSGPAHLSRLHWTGILTPNSPAHSFAHNRTSFMWQSEKNISCSEEIFL